MFHVGMVVADLGSAMHDLSAQFGVEWASIRSHTRMIRYHDAAVKTEVGVTYSLQGPMHLELITTAPGSPWEAADSMHHVGFWSDDLQASGTALSQVGLILEATYVGTGDDLVGFGYFQGPGGLRVEIVDSSRRAAFNDWLRPNESSHFDH